MVHDLEDDLVPSPVDGLSELGNVLIRNLSIPPHFGAPGKPAKQA